ncbi:adenosinetriphosphatase [Planoprotostelium fungivorum]|uniref:Peroxisomal ATPase PEX1 n=1 Tax=Planoprotostelium fungivorum TaxID=1890364 RepID=A0A2P6N7U0_9EUKA|nr:adenosinetriphosphatase [Planoprotostelium fungivorum]
MSFVRRAGPPDLLVLPVITSSENTSEFKNALTTGWETRRSTEIQIVFEQFISSRASSTCFVALPAALVNSLYNQLEHLAPNSALLTLELQWLGQGGIEDGDVRESREPRFRRSFAAWAGELSSQPGYMELSPHFASCLNLVENQVIALRPLLDVPNAVSITVEPLTSDDWEILELHAEYLENHVLEQLCVVYPNQVFPLSIHHRTVVRMKITAMEPSDRGCLRLANSSDIYIAPKPRAGKKKDFSAAVSVPGAEKEKKEEERPRQLRIQRTNESFGYNSALVHPTTWTSSRWSHKSCLFVTLYPSSSVYREEGNDDKEEKKETNEDKEATKDSTPTNKTKKSITLRITPSEKARKGHILISNESLLDLCGDQMDQLFPNFHRIRVEPNSSLTIRKLEYINVSQIIQANDTTYEHSQVFDAILEWSRVNVKAENTIIPFINGSRVVLKVENQSVPFLFHINRPNPEKEEKKTETVSMNATILLNMADVRYSTFTLDPPSILPTYTSPPPSLLSLQRVRGMHKQKEDSLHFMDQVMRESVLELRKVTQTQPPCGLFVHGVHGSGKTFLARSLLDHYQRDEDSMAYTEIFQCGGWADKKIESVKARLTQVLKRVVQNRPSVLLFDDIDLLTPPSDEAEDLRSTQIAHFIIDSWNQITEFVRRKKNGNVCLLATAHSISSYHNLFHSGHLVTHSIELGAPNRKEREEMIEGLMREKREEEGMKMEGEEEMKERVAEWTEGYLATDLNHLLERAIVASSIRYLDESQKTEGDVHQMTMKLVDFTEAQKNFTPMSLKGIQLHKSEVEWKDIGGLDHVKSMLKETLQWPNKYPKLFENIPLRPRSGLMLYGAPGSGKTLLASAVAKECGLNFISVKGPELLNKYIGASEQSVRDLFRRASQARPCILFFDEFDSIAPRSTGVTDRVVNQLLTQLDGVEALQGVYVLAATSRPDLIDPALLRPGRLDKSLYCNIPTREEREEILSCVSRKMKFSSDVSFSDLAERCVHFSGADLQALLYNAQLESVHQSIDGDVYNVEEKEREDIVAFRIDGKDEHPETSKIVERMKSGTTGTKKDKKGGDAKRIQYITQDHIEKAMDTSRPSLSDKERRRFERIYEGFVSSRDNIANPYQPTGKRSTLA